MIAVWAPARISRFVGFRHGGAGLPAPGQPLPRGQRGVTRLYGGAWQSAGKPNPTLHEDWLKGSVSKHTAELRLIASRHHEWNTVVRHSAILTSPASASDLGWAVDLGVCAAWGVTPSSW